MKQETQGGMRIKSGTFYRSYGGGEYFNTQGLGEIAVAGRSNAGKSSMINFLLKNGKAARVSAQPGKTRLVNYFLVRTETDGVRGEFFLADLPG